MPLSSAKSRRAFHSSSVHCSLKDLYNLYILFDATSHLQFKNILFCSQYIAFFQASLRVLFHCYCDFFNICDLSKITLDLLPQQLGPVAANFFAEITCICEDMLMQK